MSGRPLLLVVDDNEEVRQSLAELLGEAGYEVALADNGACALGLLGAGLRPALVLLDLHMPVMNGLEFHDAVRADPRWTDLPIVIVSASRDLVGSAPRGVCMQPKPVQADHLLEAIERHRAR